MSNYIEFLPQRASSQVRESYEDTIPPSDIKLSKLTEILRDFSCISSNIIESAKIFELITNNSTDLITIYIPLCKKSFGIRTF